MPKDLGIKIGTKTEAKWTEILKAQEEALIANKINQELAELIIDLANKRILEEKEKFK